MVILRAKRQNQTNQNFGWKSSCQFLELNFPTSATNTMPKKNKKNQPVNSKTDREANRLTGWHKQNQTLFHNTLVFHMSLKRVTFFFCYCLDKQLANTKILNQIKWISNLWFVPFNICSFSASKSPYSVIFLQHKKCLNFFPTSWLKRNQ